MVMSDGVAHLEVTASTPITITRQEGHAINLDFLVGYALTTPPSPHEERPKKEPSTHLVRNITSSIGSKDRNQRPHPMKRSLIGIARIINKLKPP